VKIFTTARTIVDLEGLVDPVEGDLGCLVNLVSTFTSRHVMVMLVLILLSKALEFIWRKLLDDSPQP
jgi:hypothetical protein